MGDGNYQSTTIRLFSVWSVNAHTLRGKPTQYHFCGLLPQSGVTNVDYRVSSLNFHVNLAWVFTVGSLPVKDLFWSPLTTNRRGHSGPILAQKPDR